jgi:hypothetical protein
MSQNKGVCQMETVFEALINIFAIIAKLGMVLAVAWAILCYLISIYPKYYMFKSAGIAHWLSFIPVVGDAMMLKLIGWSPWLYIAIYLGGLIPIIGWIAAIVINAIINWKIAERFGMGDIGKILSLFFGGIVHWYIALSGKTHTAIASN